MWFTTGGERSLEGAERDLVLSGAMVLAEQLEDSADLGISGQKQFEGLHEEDKRHILLKVIRDLVEDSPAPPRRWWGDAAIAAVFNYLSTMVDMEIEEDNGKDAHFLYWRALVSRAYLEADVDYDDEDLDYTENQRLDSKNRDAWDAKIEAVLDGILPDRDFEMADSKLMDAAPDVAEAVKQYVGIGKEYLTEAPIQLDRDARAKLEAKATRWSKASETLYLETALSIPSKYGRS